MTGKNDPECVQLMTATEVKYTAHPEYRAHIAGIIQNPADDLPRLVLADWLDEHGQHDRAEFIRVQCEIERLKRECTAHRTLQRKVTRLKKRERELYDLGAAVVLEESHLRPGDDVSGIQWGFVRGFVHTVRCRYADWLSGKCETCNGRGRLLDNGNGGSDRWPCGVCQAKGTLSGFGADVVRLHPVGYVQITAARVFPSGGNNTYYLGGLSVFPSKYWRRLENLPDQQAVHKALSAVLIEHARERAGQS